MPGGDRGGGTVAQPRTPDVGAVRRRGTVQDGCVGRGLHHLTALRAALLDVGLGVGLLLGARAAELLVGGLVALAVRIDADRLLPLLLFVGVLVATLHGGGLPAARYIESGALTPSRSSARAIVRWAATHSRRRRSSTTW